MNVSFNIHFHTVWGQRLSVVGSVPELGMWEPAFAKEMTCRGNGHWQLELALSSGVQEIEYRYFLSGNDKPIFEEWEKNHRIVLDDQAERYTLYDYWQTRPANPAFYSSAFTKCLFARPCRTSERVARSRKQLVIKISAPRVEKHQHLAISGNQARLGNWDTKKALILSCDAFPEWQITLDASEITYPLEYKFLVVDDKHELVYWETDENRKLYVSSQMEGEVVAVSGLYFRDNLPLWRCAGTVIPVFSLRSGQSFGIGDLGDLRKFIDWIKKTHQRIIQVLPMNDTTMSYTWLDSYPYSAISIYALHPVYIDLLWMGALNDAGKAAFYAEKQKELNSKESVDYEGVLTYKIDYCRIFFEQEGQSLLESPEYAAFYRENASWLIPYAAYSYFRDTYKTPDFSKWGGDAIYNKQRIDRLCDKTSEAYPEVSFFFFLQFILHTQFRNVSDYARRNGIVLKGDIPIGVNRTSVEVWTEPDYFNLDAQAGAPPDDFSVNGQNWMFPTYNWEAMERDDFSWWKKRLLHMNNYFDCFRIDHILGFFRIWEIPQESVQGLRGHFNPALPFSKEEIEHYGLSFNESRFTTPHIRYDFLPELFGDLTDEVKNAYLAQSSSRHFVLKPFCDTQRKIEALFDGKGDQASLLIRNGLYAIANETLFLPDRHEKGKFHPRISANQSFIYRELTSSDRYAFDHLYWEFFYHRHNHFWRAQAFKRLTPLIASTQMLVCGEDLGMIPESVPDVMNKLQILSLEIERMPKAANREFADLRYLPYLSVCTTSTHDMSPLRNWWKEDQAKTERYDRHVLQYPAGAVPDECTAEIATQIISNHLAAPSMLAIIPLQDWFAVDDTIKRKDIESERINIPANPAYYWRYRMHITIERLMDADVLNDKIRFMIEQSKRK
ncbi:MAG: 4-alpha-glucanotransferase [Tannerellaceae bacterium]|jgi:4-alpha-glucanotransferase|nr:4-alpha-glucanotransferase [Tannerellaceae bacterium]